MNAITFHPKLVTFGIGLVITFGIGAAIGMIDNYPMASAARVTPPIIIIP